MASMMSCENTLYMYKLRRHGNNETSQLKNVACKIQFVGLKLFNPCL